MEGSYVGEGVRLGSWDERQFELVVEDDGPALLAPCSLHLLARNLSLGRKEYIRIQHQVTRVLSFSLPATTYWTSLSPNIFLTGPLLHVPKIFKS